MDIPEFQFENNPDENFFELENQLLDSLQNATSLPLASSTTPKEMVLLKAIMLPLEVLNQPQRQLAWGQPYQIKQQEWPKYLFGKGFARAGRTHATPFNIPNLTTVRPTRECILQEIIRMTSILSPQELLEEVNMALADPAAQFMARVETDRPFTGISLGKLPLTFNR